MHKSYPTKLIWDYIMGKEIENIDELEANYKFMIEVIKHTKDKKIYFLCADEVKSNKDFVLFMIDTFEEDKDFLIDVTNYYLNSPHANQDYSIFEVSIRMQQILEVGDPTINRKLSNALLEHSSLVAFLYLNIILVVNKTIEEETDQNVKKELGLGFALIKEGEMFSSSIIQDYFAKCFLKEILRSEQGNKLEKTIHQRFNSFSTIEKVGIYPVLISYIASMDLSLSKHVEAHTYLLSDMIEEMKIIEKNWDNYEENHYHDKMNLFYEIVNKKIEKYHASIDSDTYFRYIDKLNLGIKTKLGHYPDDYDDELEMKVIEIEDIEKIRTLKINEWQCLKEIITLAKKIFSRKIVDLAKIENEELRLTFNTKPQTSLESPAQIVAFPQRKRQPN